VASGMIDLLKRAWRALTVPTFKMRIGQTFVVVLCLVSSLVIVGAIVLIRSSNARSQAQDGAVINRGADALAEAAASFDSSALSQVLGQPAGARASTDSGLARLGVAASEFKKSGVAGAADLERKTTTLAARVSGVAGTAEAAEARALSGDSEALADTVLKGAVNEGRGVVRFGIIAYIIILIVTVIAGMVTMAVAYRGLSGIVKKVIAEVRDIARGTGDLTATVSVPTKDVMGDLADSINEMIFSLRESMIEIRTIAVELANSADSLAGSIEGMSSSIEEVTSASEQISTGSEDQARKVEDTSHAMAEVSRAIEGIAEKAQVSARQSEITAEVAERGGEASQEATVAMAEIFRSVKHSEQLVEGLGERFTQIGIIIDVITDIADQTNLLALNAAIEAARAGEHGKGFAVVAGEVRKLAENSKRSAEQISHLIREITSETSRVSVSMAESTGRVDTGQEVAQKAGEALEGIMNSSGTAARAASEISMAIQGIAGNTDRVFGAINDIAAIAQETVASTQEVAATINEQRVSTEDVAEQSLALARLASKLHELTDGFKV
jgi:methyl-accepting chemotaxis protein